jgi:hypothetical protein
MRVVAVLSLCVLLTSCKSADNAGYDYTFQKSLSYEELVSLHLSQLATSKGYKYESGALVTEHNKHWPLFARKCRALLADEGKDIFEFVFVLDRNGKVIDARSPSQGNAASCFISGIKKITYPSPPYEYWYELVTVR